jgi:hypothetical protein
MPKANETEPRTEDTRISQPQARIDHGARLGIGSIEEMVGPAMIRFWAVLVVLLLGPSLLLLICSAGLDPARPYE